MTIFDNCIDWVNITTRLSSQVAPVGSGLSADHAKRVSLDIRKQVAILGFQANVTWTLRQRVDTAAWSKFYGQATKGARWMPWQKQAMKDVASCDKLRGAAHR